MSRYFQTRNDELEDGLRATFQPRYEPNFAWKSACSAFLALPALRAFWPMSSVDYAAATQGRDVAGGGYHLTNNNSADFGYDDLAPYVAFDGVNQFLQRADGGVGNWADIIGTEGYILAAQRGLTVGGWFWPHITTNIQALIIKGQNLVADAYWLYVNPASQARFGVWNGGAITGISTGTNYTVDNWYFWVGRFTPSAEVAIHENGTWTRNVAGIPANIQDSASPFTIADWNPGAAPSFNGKASMCFLCASALSDAQIFSLYQQTKAMYGV